MLYPLPTHQISDAFKSEAKNLWLPRSWRRGFKISSPKSPIINRLLSSLWANWHQRLVTGSQAQKKMPNPVNTGKKLIWVPRTSTQWGKGLAPLLTGHLCRTHKSTTETHFREASFYKLILFGLWLGKSGAEPWKQTGLYQTGKCLSLGLKEKRVLCRNIQWILFTLNLTGICCSRTVYYGVGGHS